MLVNPMKISSGDFKVQNACTHFSQLVVGWYCGGKDDSLMFLVPFWIQNCRLKIISGWKLLLHPVSLELWWRLYGCLVTGLSLSFFIFLLPVLEYCSPVFMSAAAALLCFLDRVVSWAVKLSYGEGVYDLMHRRRIAVICMFYKIL